MKAGAAFHSAYGLLVLATLMWGGNAVAGKLAVLDWQPWTITGLRWLLTTLLLLPFALQPLRNDRAVLRKTWPRLFLLGAFGMGLFNLLMYLAANHTTAINISILQASMPVMIMLANFFILSQRVTGLQIVGLLVSTLGVLITTTKGDPLAFFSKGLNYGDAIMLVACVFYAAYTFGLRWKPAVHWLSFMWLISLGAFCMTIPFALWELQQATFTVPGLRGWLVMAYVIIFPTIVAQISYARGVELLGSNRAGLFINLVPIFGSILAVLVLRENFKLYHAAGLVMVIGGIMLAERFSASAAR